MFICKCVPGMFQTQILFASWIKPHYHHPPQHSMKYLLLWPPLQSNYPLPPSKVYRRHKKQLRWQVHVTWRVYEVKSANIDLCYVQYKCSIFVWCDAYYVLLHSVPTIYYYLSMHHKFMDNTRTLLSTTVWNNVWQTLCEMMQIRLNTYLTLHHTYHSFTSFFLSLELEQFVLFNPPLVVIGGLIGAGSQA